MFEIETDRLKLRQFTPDDLDELAPILAKPDVTRFLGVAGEPLSRADAEKALRGISAHWERHGFGRWAAVYKENAQVIGYGGLRCYGKHAELLYLLDKPYWGQGLATEIANACLKYSFEVKSFDHIVAMVKPDHRASRHVLEKVGMRCQNRAGYFRLLEEVGMMHLMRDLREDIDVVQYSILQTDYRKRKIAA